MENREDQNAISEPSPEAVPSPVASPGREALDRFARLERLVLAVASAATSEEVAEALLAESLSASGADAGTVFSLSADGSERVVLHTVFSPLEATRRSAEAANFSEAMSEAIQTRQPLFIETFAERSVRCPDWQHRAGGALAALPLIVGEQTLGVLELSWPEDRPFSPEDRALLRIIAPVGALALERARLHQQAASESWERTHLETRLQEHITRSEAAAEELEVQRVALTVTNARLEAANRYLASLSTTDALTGLKNLRAFQEEIALECQRAERYATPLSLLMLDVDHFKNFNDRWGHPRGDDALKTVGKILQQTARVTDFVARYGGEEFVVLLPNTDVEGAETLCERFRLAIEAHAWDLSPLTASLGIATRTPALQTASQLIAASDAALYAAKRNGRNCCTHARALPEVPGESPSGGEESPSGERG